MAFVSGLVLGLVFGFAYYCSIRSRGHFELAAMVAAFVRMTVEDSRKLLPGELYPSWVAFTRRKELTWLDLQLKKIWPYVDAVNFLIALLAAY